MALFNTLTTHDGTFTTDFFFGDGGGPNHIFNGEGGDDFMLGDSVSIFVDDNNDNASAPITNVFTQANAFNAAMDLDDIAHWSTVANPSIEDDSIPHTTVYASGGGGSGQSNYYTVTVGAGETLTLDIDGTSSNVDTYISIRRSSSTAILADNDDSAVDVGSRASRDSFLQYTNNTGAAVEYLIEVFDNEGNFGVLNQYLLNVSVTNHSVGGDVLVEGDNELFGGAGDDILFGLAGRDLLFGDNGNDLLYGGDGQDQLIGGDGDDYLYGGDQFDQFTFYANDGNDYYDGGDGVDRINFASAGGGVTINLSLETQQNTINFGLDTFINIESVSGTQFGDIILGSNENNTLSGGQGNDRLEGRAGNDNLSGDSGVDNVFGGGGDDRIVIYNFTEIASGETYDGGDDTDQLAIRSGSSQFQDVDFRNGITVRNFETIVITMGTELGGVVRMTQSQWEENNIVELTAFTAADLNFEIYADSEAVLDISTLELLGLWTDAGYDITLIGDAQDNALIGSSGIDTIRGGAGEDDLNGGGGNDRIEGGTFSDILFGGTGEDVLIGGSGNDVIDGWTGFDTALYTGLSTGVTVDLQITSAQDTGGGGIDTLVRVENLVGSSQDDVLTGNFNRNRLEGGNGNDTLSGMGQNDTLIGGAGNDTLIGGTGADTLVGGAGEDTLDGGNQRDRLDGGADDDILNGGNDVDRLLGGDGVDILTGGNGTDFLFGGTGNDIFVFNDVSESGVGPYNRDEIRDWNDGDQIDVSAIDADITAVGNRAFFVVPDEFTGNAGEIMIQSLVRSGVDVQLVSFDIDGDAQADMQLWVLASELDAADFVL